MFTVLLPYAIAFIVGATSGSFVTNEINSFKLADMQMEIIKQREQANKILLHELEKSSAQYEKNQILSSNLDRANEQSVQTINILDNNLKSLRLRYGTSGKGCNSSETTNNHSRKPEEETKTIEFPEGIHRFLTEKSYDSGLIDNYVESCYTFVVEHNCGIPKE